MPANELDNDLLNDPNFRHLVFRFVREAMTWDEFLDQPLPRNMSASRMWALLNDLSRDAGVPVPVPDLEGNEYWYRRTFKLTDTAVAVEAACRRDSRLYRTMSAAAGHHFMLKSRITETIASARLDGLDISEAEAETVLRLGTTPQSAAEKLVTNTFAAMDQLDALVDQPFSRALLDHIRDILAKGIDPSELTVSEPSKGLVSFDYEDSRVVENVDRQLNYIIDYANHVTGDPYDRPLLRALLMTDLFRLYRPYGVLSSQVGRLAARFYELKHDLPVVGMLPVSRAKLEWEQGIIAPPVVTYDLASFLKVQERSLGDITIYFTLSCELALLTLKRIERYVDGWERRDAEMREILRKEPLLNQRQRSILARALKVTDAEFNIRYHKRNHNIAYTTARRDLLELTDKGYLKMEQRGKAFIFTGAEKLYALIAQDETQESDAAELDSMLESGLQQ